MKVHPRTFEVQKVHNEMATAVTEVIAKHDLTHAELTQILLQIMLFWNRYAVRDERGRRCPPLKS